MVVPSYSKVVWPKSSILMQQVEWHAPHEKFCKLDTQRLFFKNWVAARLHSEQIIMPITLHKQQQIKQACPCNKTSEIGSHSYTCAWFLASRIVIHKLNNQIEWMHSANWSLPEEEVLASSYEHITCWLRCIGQLERISMAVNRVLPFKSDRGLQTMMVDFRGHLLAYYIPPVKVHRLT